MVASRLAVATAVKSADIILQRTKVCVCECVRVGGCVCALSDHQRFSFVSDFQRFSLKIKILYDGMAHIAVKRGARGVTSLQKCRVFICAPRDKVWRFASSDNDADREDVPPIAEERSPSIDHQVRL